MSRTRTDPSTATKPRWSARPAGAALLGTPCSGGAHRTHPPSRALPSTATHEEHALQTSSGTECWRTSQKTRNPCRWVPSTSIASDKRIGCRRRRPLVDSMPTGVAGRAPIATNGAAPAGSLHSDSWELYFVHLQSPRRRNCVLAASSARRFASAQTELTDSGAAHGSTASLPFRSSFLPHERRWSDGKAHWRTGCLAVRNGQRTRLSQPTGRPRTDA